MTYEIVHRTAYTYDADVVANYSEARLTPRSLAAHQHVRSSRLTIEPEPEDRRVRTDLFGNVVTYFSIEAPHRRLVVTASSTVDVTDPRPGPPDGATATRPWEEARRVVAAAGPDDPDGLAARPFVLDSPLVGPTPEVHRYARVSFVPGRPAVEALADLRTRIFRDFRYEPGATSLTSTLADVLERRAGVCQDFAHLAIACARSVGLPARYVSGYLETTPPPGGEKVLGADASHAWCSVFVPGAGWLDQDPTNDQVPDERYITTAWGRDYGDVTPLKGVVFSSSRHPELTVAVDVLRLPS